jgi:hypothetical protein
MKKHIASLAFVSLLATTGSALAGPTCSDGPNENWKSEEAMKAQIAEQGYKVKKFKISRGQCYEIYGWDKEGHKVEVYFDPITGEIVKQEVDS